MDPRARRLRRPRAIPPRRARAALVAALALACAGPDPSPRLPAALGGTVTVEQERAIGAEVHRRIRASGALLVDPLVLAHLNELGQRLVRTTEPQPFLFRFHLVRDDALNAFAVPGGHVYVHTGVLASVDDPAELAGVLAHEIAHVTLRHFARTQEKQALVRLATLAAAVLSGGDPAVTAIAAGINVSLEIRHTREHEREADREAVRILEEAGYDPEGLARFLARIEAARSSTASGVPPYLFTHPEPGERIAAVRALARRASRGAPATAPEEFERLRAAQTRLAARLEPVAGGSGLLARARFDRTRTDPLLAEAERAIAAGDRAAALAALEGAAAAEPRDPRVWLLRAELAEREDDLEGAAEALERAFALDPEVPLVQYRLGLVYRALGERVRAAFFLDLAASGFGPRGPARQAAEVALRSVETPLLARSGVGSAPGSRAAGPFAPGDTVVWWGDLAVDFAELLPVAEVRWIGPDGRVARVRRFRLAMRGRYADRFETEAAAPGAWRVEVRIGRTLLDRQSFVVRAAGTR